MRVGRIYIISDTNQISPIYLKTAANALLTTKGIFFYTINIHVSHIAVAERVFSRPYHHFRGKTLEVSLLTVRTEQLGKSEEFLSYEQVSFFKTPCQHLTREIISFHCSFCLIIAFLISSFQSLCLLSLSSFYFFLLYFFYHST